MATYTLTPELLASYKALWDFRTQFVRAARQILEAGGIQANSPGDNVQQIPRYQTSIDFRRSGATGGMAPVRPGGWRYHEYAQYEGTLIVQNTVPYQTDAETGITFVEEDHLRKLDELQAIEHTLFMEHLEPFTAALLPKLDVQKIIPIDPDERPEAEREINTAMMRWRIVFQIRAEAWPE